MVYTGIAVILYKLVTEKTMPLYEYECDSCMQNYNDDIDVLVQKLNKTNASRVIKKNPNISFIEVKEEGKNGFSIGKKNTPSIRRFIHKINKKILYMELKNFRFSELITEKGDEKDLVCPLCKDGRSIRRVFSTFKAIFDDKNKRAPRPGDDIKFHMDYKVQKDEEMRNDWVGQDHLNQYFNR